MPPSNQAPNNENEPPTTPNSTSSPPPFPLCFNHVESPGAVERTARYLQVQLSRRDRQLKESSRQTQDALNQASSEGSSNNGRKRARETNDEDEEDNGPDNIQERIHRGARLYATVGCVFLHEGAATFEEILPADFNEHDETQRFASSANKAKGQLKDALACLPESVTEYRNDFWFGSAFCHSKKGLGGRRSTIAGRLRSQIESALDVTPEQFESSLTRREFREDIGYQPDKGEYSATNVKILHGKWEGKYNLQEFLRSQTVMKVFVAILRGAEAAKHFVPGKIFPTRSETMESKYHVRNITPQAIANAAILTVWVYSADDSLQPIGNVTNINYLKHYDLYLQIMLKGLRTNVAHICELIRVWDDAVFPQTDSSILKTRRNTSSTVDNEAADILDALDNEPREPEPDPEETPDEDDSGTGNDDNGASAGGGDGGGSNGCDA